MPLSTDICLPRNHEVLFPCRCLLCDRPEPESRLQLSAAISGWWSTLFWLPWPRYRIEVPVCRGCRKKYLRRQQITSAIVWITAAVLIWFLLPEIRNLVPAPLQKIVMLTIIGLCLLPLILREMLNPPAINITAYSDRVDFEFASAEKAMEFIGLNSKAAWLKLDGEEVSYATRKFAELMALQSFSDDIPDEHEGDEMPR